MNAKELLQEWKERCNRLPRTAGEEDYQTILSALSLLAAAEANDGTTPETDAAEIKVQLGSDYALTGTVHYTTCARLERERNGLALAHAAGLAVRMAFAGWKAAPP